MDFYVVFRRRAWASLELLDRAAPMSRRGGDEMKDRGVPDGGAS